MSRNLPHPGWQERTLQLLGEEKFSRLATAHVLVVGLGGVGAMAAEMICRSGIGAMTIIDGDIIQPSNINRQLPATHQTLERSKAEVMGDRLLEINPGLRLTIRNEFMDQLLVPGLLDQSFDFVVDAIDTLSPKIELIHHTLKRGLRLTSSMGSGGKTDPSRVMVADFSETFNCRLAYLLRKKLRKLDIHGGFKVVYSTEQVSRDMIVAVEGERNKKSTVGTISYIPAVFGCMLASVVIRELLESQAK